MKKFINILFRHRFDIIYGSILILFLLFMFIFFPKTETKNIINAMENKSFDLRQSIISKNKKSSDDIVIVSVDDPSYEYLLDKYGDWPIPRDVYAQILEYIQSQGAKYVGFDLLFIKSLNRIPQSDNKLINSFKKYKNTYTALNFDNYSKELRTPPVIDDKLKTKITLPDSIKPFEFTNCRLILSEIIEATKNIGHINTPKSDDGFIRQIPLFIKYNNDIYSFMTFKLALDSLNIDIEKSHFDKNNNLIVGNKKIPLSNNAEAILNWYSPKYDGDYTFKYISFWEVLKSYEAKKNNNKEILPQDTFKNKIVFIGTSVFSLSDIKTVPVSKYMPGVEIHATLLNNIIDNSLIRKASNSQNILITVFLAFICIMTVFKIRSVTIGITLFGIINIVFLYISTYVMEKYNIWIWTIIPLITTVITFLYSYIIKYLIKSRDFEYTYKLATTDGLTELYNHRYFQEQIRFKIKQAERLNTTFSLIIADIDFFKKFNDTYGHQAGDAVLKEVAKTLKSCVRSEDYVCRYGGEEMTIILNNTNRESAYLIAKKVCDTIASKKYQLTPDLEVNVTLSLGVASYPNDGKTPSALIEYADKCLYKAKENGRNQVGFIE